MNYLYQIGYNLFKFCGNVFFSFRVVHQERMIEEGPAILAMNHQSFIDPPLAGICTRREIYFLARKSLTKWPIVGPIMTKVKIIPVDRGGNDMTAVKTIIRLIKSGEAALLFPEGTRTKDGRLGPAQAGIGLIIAKTLAPVIPMRVFGAFEALPRSGKSFKPGPVTIVVGKPIYFTEADIAEGGKDLYQRLGDRVMAAIAAIEYEE